MNLTHSHLFIHKLSKLGGGLLKVGPSRRNRACASDTRPALGHSDSQPKEIETP